ncbi:MAG: ABC transporter substrate-binding protein [Deltaproteobacteria bacterium]|nr:ABC transporter substrate-binding protein [Deltaproteobacteria bacterium]
MEIKNKYFIGAGVLGMFFLLLLTAPLSTTAAGKDAEIISSWVWTKDKPKPLWWKWDDEKDKPVRGGYIYAASTNYIGLMNPNHWPVLDWVSITNMYEGLVYIDGEYQPTFLWLAESYEYPEPTTCVMNLRKGVKFHDGSDFNAGSLKYLIDYIKDKRNGCWTRAWVEPIKSIEVVDEYTVRWNFKRPWAGFLGMMATTPGYMISKKALEGDVAMKKIKKLTRYLKKANDKAAQAEKKARKAVAKGGAEADKAAAAVKEARKKVAVFEEEMSKLAAIAKGAKDVDTNPVGSGRYMLEKASPGNFLRLKRNPNWWFGRSIGRPDMPYPDGIMIYVIPDESIRLANLRAGKIDYMVLSPTQFEALKKDPRFNITSQIGNHLVALSFNHAKGPCKDIRVRKAISHVINRKALLHGLQLGQGIIASCMYHENHWCHNPNLKPVHYDPELSKKLLAEAGYQKGLKIKGYMGNATWQVNLAEALKAMLAEVGVTWQVDSLDAAASSDRSKNLEYDLASGGWAYIKEPDMIATGLYHPNGGFNYGRSHNEKALTLIEAGKKELDLKKRQKIYWELEKVLYENYEDVWLWYPIINTARRTVLRGYDAKLHDKGGEAYWFTHPGWFKDGHR